MDGGPAHGVHAFEARLAAPLRFADFAGKVLLIVNTASHCGFTPQYAGLQKLHETYGPRGLVVIGFPCNQFGAQEPGPSRDRLSASATTASISLAEKVDVNGRAHPLFRLTAALPGVLGSSRSSGTSPSS
jgi:glutathione peroxidase